LRLAPVLHVFWSHLPLAYATYTLVKLCIPPEVHLQIKQQEHTKFRQLKDEFNSVFNHHVIDILPVNNMTKLMKISPTHHMQTRVMLPNKKPTAHSGCKTVRAPFGWWSAQEHPSAPCAA
jgi:hypothetical protein